MPEIKDFDVVVIGAGIAGAVAARALSKYDLRIGIVEKNADVCFGATKASHAMVHCGLPGGAALKDRAELEGNIMMPEICRQLDVPFRQTGKLLVAFNDQEIDSLREIQVKATRHGVKGLELIQDKARLKSMEPNLSDAVKAALYTPTTGVASPWGLVIGLIENATANGAKLMLETDVSAITERSDGRFHLQTNQGAIISSWVINAAGLYADKVSRMIGDDSFSLKLLRQERIILDKRCGKKINHLIRGLSNGNPTGDFIGPTVDGNVMVGCLVEEVSEAERVDTTNFGLREHVIPQYGKLVTGISPELCIRPFSGTIPLVGPEYHICSAMRHRRFIQFVLGPSGFTGSVAMGRYLVEEVLPDAGFSAALRPDFQPERKDIPRFSQMTNEQRKAAIAADPDWGRVICRCEMVTAGEIKEAIRRGARTRDGIKFRTRAGMGRCQSNYCGHKVLSIMSEELGIDASSLTRKGGVSYEFNNTASTPRWKKGNR